MCGRPSAAESMNWTPRQHDPLLGKQIPDLVMSAVRDADRLGLSQQLRRFKEVSEKGIVVADGDVNHAWCDPLEDRCETENAALLVQ